MTRKPTSTARRRPSGSSVYSLCEQETIAFGRRLARGLRGGELILLEGDLGLGKTVLARGIAAGLGIPERDVTSPSFTLIQHYKGGRLPLHHVDLYRLDDEEDVESIGLDELFMGEGVTVVEWGERLRGRHRRDALVVRLYDIGEGARRIELVARDADNDDCERDDA